MKDDSQTKAALLSRRGFLLMGACLPTALLLPTAFAAPMPPVGHLAGERRLSFHNTHTGENLSEVYWADGQYQADGLQQINHILRDHRTGEIYQIDEKLLDLLFVLQAEVNGKRPYEIISGYRSPATNAMLGKKSSAVARKSFHMQGKAIDIRLPRCQLNDLHQAALSMKAGGVGCYPVSDFIHVDVGPVRRW